MTRSTNRYGLSDPANEHAPASRDDRLLDAFMGWLPGVPKPGKRYPDQDAAEQAELELYEAAQRSLGGHVPELDEVAALHATLPKDPRTESFYLFLAACVNARPEAVVTYRSCGDVQLEALGYRLPAEKTLIVPPGTSAAFIGPRGKGPILVYERAQFVCEDGPRVIAAPVFGLALFDGALSGEACGPALVVPPGSVADEDGLLLSLGWPEGTERLRTALGRKDPNVEAAPTHISVFSRDTDRFPALARYHTGLASRFSAELPLEEHIRSARTLDSNRIAQDILALLEGTP